MISPIPLRIHILTSGYPEVEKCPDGFILHNGLIGKDFHWHSKKRLHFRGEYEIFNDRLISTIDVEQYLCSVIASEMNPEAPAEFLKAHAVISRSWAMGKILGTHAALSPNESIHSSDTIIGFNDTGDHRDFHVCNDDHCQRYQGIPDDSNRKRVAEEAVEATRGLVLTDSDGNIADARFSKHCGGHTELFSTCWQENDPHYLKSFEDPFCDLSDMTETDRNAFLSTILNDYDLGTPFEVWSVELTREEIRKYIHEKFGHDTGKIQGLAPLQRGPSGRIKMLKIVADHPLTLGKELFIRRALSPSHLLSSDFQITETSQGFRLDGKGWGHGVGLCQIGAARMAKEGADFRQILNFYYPTATLTDWNNHPH